MKKSFFFFLVLLLGCGPDEIGPVVESEPDNAGYILDEFKGSQFIAYADESIDFYNVISTETLEGEQIEFQIESGKYAEILEDMDGGRWTNTGRCLTGPNQGKQLKHMNFITGFWFSLSAFFPKVSLYGSGDEEKIDLVADDPEWTINPQIVYAASFMDGIQSLNEPDFVNFNAPKTDVGVTDLDPQESVLVTITKESIRIYPLSIMDWHEIVNFSENGNDYVVSYCPLTGTSGFWDVTAMELSGFFGVSGLLYNNNLVLYDHETLSYWSQIKQEAVHGQRIGQNPVYLPIYEMTFEAAMNTYFEFEILSKETGYGLPYEEYPYGDHKTNHRAVGYPRSYVDDRLLAKERVVSVIVDDQAKVYRFSDFK